MGHEARLPGCNSQGYHLLAEWLGSAPSCLSTLIWKTGHFHASFTQCTSENLQLREERAMYHFFSTCPLIHWERSRHLAIALVLTHGLLRITATLRSVAFLLACPAKWNDLPVCLQKKVNSNSKNVARGKTALNRATGLTLHPTFVTIHVTIKCHCVPIWAC